MKETEDVLSSLKDDGVEIETMFFQELQQPRCVSFLAEGERLVGDLFVVVVAVHLRGASRGCGVQSRTVRCVLVGMVVT